MTLNDHMANDSKRLALPSLYTAEDVAATLGISVKTVHKLVREGKLECVQVTSRERRFTPEQVQEFIHSKTISKRVDRKAALPVSSRPRKGGENSSRVFDRADLLKEMRSWQS